MATYVLLMRHGAHKSGALTPEAQERVPEVARALKQFICETKGLPQHTVALRRFWRASSQEAKSTAELFGGSLGNNPAWHEKNKLTPKHMSPYGPPGKHFEALLEDIIGHVGAEPGDALIIVGHQPILGWIAQALSGHSLPIAHAELLCLRFAEPPRARRWWRWWARRLVDKPAVLRWVLTPTAVADRKAMAELRDKIRGKMEGAKLLGTFITAILGIMLATLVDSDKLIGLGEYQYAFYVSAGLFCAASVLYFASYYAYDRLLMPVRFWSESIAKDGHPDWLVMRPPSSALWVLYQNMMRVWGRFFTPAMFLVYLGLVALAFAVVQPAREWWAYWVIAVAVLGIVFRPLYRMFGPRLGSQD